MNNIVKKEKLYILWTNPDIITAEKMVFMYGTNSIIHKWWKEVTIIIWGSTTKLVAENKDVQEKVKVALYAGVNVSACKSCAEQLGLVEPIKDLGVELKYWGEDLTNILKEKETLLTI